MAYLAHSVMNSRLIALFFALLLIVARGMSLPLTAQAASTSVYVVDVERVLTRSRAAQAGQNHLKDARRALEQGFEQLRKMYDGQPEETRQRILSEGANALTRQLNVEQQAVNAIISKMMLDAIRIWRQTNKADIVMAKQNLLDASDSVDITGAIIQAMDAKPAKFPDLPVVNVNPPQASPQQPAAPQAQPGRRKR